MLAITVVWLMMPSAAAADDPPINIAPGQSVTVPASTGWKVLVDTCGEPGLHLGPTGSDTVVAPASAATVAGVDPAQVLSPASPLTITAAADAHPGVVVVVSWTTFHDGCFSAGGSVTLQIARSTASAPKPPRDPCVVPNRRFGGKTPAERAYYRSLALAFNEAAWDGQELADRADLVGHAVDFILQTDVDLDPGAPGFAGVGEALEQEAALVAKRTRVLAEARTATYERDAAELRQRRSLAELKTAEAQVEKLQARRNGGKRIGGDTIDKWRREAKRARAALELADLDVDRARAAFSRAHGRVGALDRELAALRKALGGRLRSLAAALAKSPAARNVGKLLNGLNLVQDAAALWMVPNAVMAAYFNRLAQPPPGCNEAWTKSLPKRPGVSLRAASAPPQEPPMAAAARAGAAFQPLAPSPFVSRADAAAFAALTDNLVDQLAAVRALEDEVQRTGDPHAPSARRLAERLARALTRLPGRARAVASVFAFEPILATPEALARRDPTAADVKASLRRLGAPGWLISAVDGRVDTTVAGMAIDPFALFRDPALETRVRDAAKALRSSS